MPREDIIHLGVQIFLRGVTAIGVVPARGPRPIGTAVFVPKLIRVVDVKHNRKIFPFDLVPHPGIQRTVEPVRQQLAHLRLALDQLQPIEALRLERGDLRGEAFGSMVEVGEDGIIEGAGNVSAVGVVLFEVERGGVVRGGIGVECRRG